MKVPLNSFILNGRSLPCTVYWMAPCTLRYCWETFFQLITSVFIIITWNMSSWSFELSLLCSTLSFQETYYCDQEIMTSLVAIRYLLPIEYAGKSSSPSRPSVHMKILCTRRLSSRPLLLSWNNWLARKINQWSVVISYEYRLFSTSYDIELFHNCFKSSFFFAPYTLHWVNFKTQLFC